MLLLIKQSLSTIFNGLFDGSRTKAPNSQNRFPQNFRNLSSFSLQHCFSNKHAVRAVLWDRAPSAGLQVMQNREERLVHQRVVLPRRGTSAGWRSGQWGAFWQSAKVNVKACAWEGDGLWAAAWRARTWDRLTINQFRNKKHPGLLKNIQWGEGAYPSTLVSAQRTTTGPVHSPRLSSTVKDGYSGASATRTTKGLECLSREGLRQLGQFVLKKRWSKGISSMHIYI